MLAYAANRRRHAQRGASPQAMLAIAVAHVALIAVVMSARMDLPARFKAEPTAIKFIELAKPPPPEPRAQPERPPQDSRIDTPPVIRPIPQPSPPPLDARPNDLIPATPAVGTALQPPLIVPPTNFRPSPPVRTGPRFATPDHALRPPYPRAKLDTAEEAVLRLRLSIDERGRVTAVEAVGRADRAFLDAARRHLIARWRYQPATEGGRPIASSTVITLRFELE